MKKLGKLKLNQFSKAELDQRKMNAILGGYSDCTVCACVCVGDSRPSANVSGATAANTAGATPRG